MNRMLKIIPFLLLSLSALAQNIKTAQYVSLINNNVYDVELIIFAYNTTLPSEESYLNKPIFDTSQAFELLPKPDDSPLIKNQQNSQSNTDYTISINEDENSLHVLAWFEHDRSDFKLNGIWEKLQNKDDIIPLVHRSWRQAETPFESPEYIKISTINPPSDELLMDEIIYPDFALLGEVAFSKGRYIHFGSHLNLFREINTNDEIKNMVFSLTERKQVKNNELHYFDSPWLGAIVKITKFTEETIND